MEEVKSLLSKGEIEKALDLLILEFKGKTFENDFIQLNARYFSDQRNLSRGLIDYSAFQLNQNRIVHDILALIDATSKEEHGQSVGEGSETPVRKVAFCEANPLEHNLLSNVEARELKALFDRGTKHLQLSLHFALSLDDFLETVNDIRPEVIHFSAFANAEGILFHDREDKPVKVSNTILAMHLGGLPHQPECIFFNTFIDPEFARSLSAGETFIIGFNAIIDSYAAIAFATGFYTALAYGKDFANAYEIGHQTLSNGKYLKYAQNLYAFQNEERR